MAEVTLRKALKSAPCHQEEAEFPEDLLPCWEDGVALGQGRAAACWHSTGGIGERPGGGLGGRKGIISVVSQAGIKTSDCPSSSSLESPCNPVSIGLVIKLFLAGRFMGKQNNKTKATKELLSGLCVT